MAVGGRVWLRPYGSCVCNSGSPNAKGFEALPFIDPDRDNRPKGRLVVGLIDTPFNPGPALDCDNWVAGAVPNTPGVVNGIVAEDGPRPWRLIPLFRVPADVVCWC